MNIIKTQVGIIGAGPSGLLLAQLLFNEGISSVIIESRSKEKVLGQVRAGLLEQGTVDLMKKAGAAGNLLKKGLVHEGVIVSHNGNRHRIPLTELTNGKVVTIYGQQELTQDLIEIREQLDEPIIFEAKATKIEGLDSTQPTIHFTQEGKDDVIECDFVAGCDGFHGISRKTIPEEITKTYDKKYPYAWLGIIAKVAPSTEELIYAYHENGFAMHSMRSKEVSRLYLQVDVEDSIENWSDEKIWSELKTRLATEGWELKEGSIVEKSITQMRSFVVEPMQYKKLFLVGDAAHIVPPTGAKGLNVAASDANNLYEALRSWYKEQGTDLLSKYSDKCLKRIWRAQDFSKSMTELFHLNPNADAYDKKIQQSKFEYLLSSKASAKTVAENYVGFE